MTTKINNPAQDTNLDPTYAVPETEAPNVPAAEQAPDVTGHDRDAAGIWHRYWKWGWFIASDGGSLYALHYHPYGTPFCIYRRR